MPMGANNYENKTIIRPQVTIQNMSKTNISGRVDYKFKRLALIK